MQEISGGPSLRMQNAVNSKQVKEYSTIAGTLNQLVRVGPQKVWRRQYTALGPSESGRSLCLYFFSEGTASGGVFSLLRKTSSASYKDQVQEERPVPLKLKSELELEQGCEVRPLDPSDVPGNKDHCFMLITSKNHL
jgi:hypothetical protein